MNDLNSLHQPLKEVEKLARRGDYKAALAMINDLLSQYPFDTRLLLLKGEIIQLLDENSPLGELKDARKALELAVKVDPKSIEALLELAYFYSAVEDNDLKALQLFDQAIQLCLTFLQEAYIGKIKSLTSSERKSEALKSIKEALRLFPDSEEIRKLEKEI